MKSQATRFIAFTRKWCQPSRHLICRSLLAIQQTLRKVSEHSSWGGRGLLKRCPRTFPGLLRFVACESVEVPHRQSAEKSKLLVFCIVVWACVWELCSSHSLECIVQQMVDMCIKPVHAADACATISWDKAALETQLGKVCYYSITHSSAPPSQGSYVSQAPDRLPALPLQVWLTGHD